MTVEEMIEQRTAVLQTALGSANSAIAAKGGTGDATTISGLADAIGTIPQGSDITVEPLSVTENGTYTADDGKAYSPVTVNVPTGGGTAEASTQYSSVKVLRITIGANTVSNTAQAHTYFLNAIEELTGTRGYMAISLVGTPQAKPKQAVKVVYRNGWAGNGMGNPLFHRVNSSATKVEGSQWDNLNYDSVLYEGDRYDILYCSSDTVPTM